MTYEYVKNQVLKLLNQYTVGGAPVADAYNNQRDYIERIPSLVNDAMMEIATTVRKIPVVVALSTLESEDIGEQVRYTLPDDFFQFKSGDTMVTAEGVTLHTRQFMLQGKKYLLVPKDEVGSYTITYYRYPVLLPGRDRDIAPDTELDNTPDTHLAIPYYAAGVLAAHEDSFLCATLCNTYNDKLSKMLPPISAEVAPVQDVYSFYTGLNG